jgi:hypothetical protein
MAMSPNKTAPTDASVPAHLAAIGDAGRRSDCEALLALMSELSAEPPRMWGPSIVGFGSYHYRYDSGREGEMCLIGFAARKTDISIYLLGGTPEMDALRLSALGGHKMGKACLYIRRLADVDMAVLRRLLQMSIAELRRRY